MIITEYIFMLHRKAKINITTNFKLYYEQLFKSVQQQSCNNCFLFKKEENLLQSL